MRWVRTQRNYHDDRAMESRTRRTRGLARCPWCGKKPAKRDFEKNAGRIAWIVCCAPDGIISGPGKPHQHWVVYQRDQVIDKLREQTLLVARPFLVMPMVTTKKKKTATP